MTQTFEMKSGDRKRALKYKTSDHAAGSARFLGASVQFRMMDPSGAVVVSAAGVVLDDDGILGYAWGAGETDTVGSYRGEFVVTFSDGLEDTYPSFGFIPVRINQEV